MQILGVIMILSFVAMLLYMTRELALSKYR